MPVDLCMFYVVLRWYHQGFIRFGMIVCSYPTCELRFHQLDILSHQECQNRRMDKSLNVGKVHHHWLDVYAVCFGKSDYGVCVLSIVLAVLLSMMTLLVVPQ
jgi:hypothetical protein